MSPMVLFRYEPPSMRSIMSKIVLPKIELHKNYSRSELSDLWSKMLFIFDADLGENEPNTPSSILESIFNPNIDADWSEVYCWYELYYKYRMVISYSFALNVRLENDFEYLVWDKDISLNLQYSSDEKHAFIRKFHRNSKKETVIPLCEVDKLKFMECKKPSEVLLIRCLNGQWYDSDVVRFRYGPGDMPKGFITRKSFNNAVNDISISLGNHGIDHSNEKLEKLLESFVRIECSNNIV